VDKKYAREGYCVQHMAERLKLVLATGPWNPNTNKYRSGADVGVILAVRRRIGVQVTEPDPFPEPGARGREKAQACASASGSYGNFVQNDAGAMLDGIGRAIERKARITPDNTLFDEIWLLVCTGLPDAPTSTLILSAALAVADLDAKTRDLLLGSHYTQCVILPFLGTEQAIFKWSRNGPARWKKSVHLEEIAPGSASDTEYVREMLRTGGKDKSVVDAQIKRVLAEVRGSRNAT
jgi:hypothetical protein